MVNKINEIIKNFGIGGEFVSYKVFNSGHINTTCMVTMEEDGVEKQYVLQKINTNVFKKPVEVMENIANVTGFIRNKLEESGYDASRMVLNFQQSQDGNYFTVDENGEYWRVYDYVDKSITFDEADEEVLRETGKAFGEFQTLLSDYPSETLFDTIPDFHNTPKRFETFKQVVESDPVGRVADVQEEIKAFLELESTASIMQQSYEKGQLPLRVTHNDTKCNNVLFDEETHKHLCVIDLDTVMPGLVGFDFGDAMRFAANTEAEDSINLENVRIDLDKYKAFTQGFIESVGDSLTEEEILTLSLGAITMTTECGLRFLTDYIDGDNYFKTNYSTHNLDRARCQLVLAQDMIANIDKMQNIVSECVRAKGLND